MKLIFKYIVTENGAILFNESTVHLQVAHGFKEIYSAGFVAIDLITGTATPTGESESIGIKSIPHLDKPIIEDLFAQASKVKYFGFRVGAFYKAAGIKPKINQYGIR